ncbi:hypothetical protein MTBBW1_2190010 [Desulfamplus magnetovallimortis]|uniref:Uncharacterized protein n=1 Tax=Desulfamplus magnetovallimortis TaxID=1246637 RepID=A0A1W1HCU8_9BACT|nr:hypothetical protein MTBBW1_2190010 [Desulfamplus magnetovallimortis]
MQNTMCVVQKNIMQFVQNKNYLKTLSYFVKKKQWLIKKMSFLSSQNRNFYGILFEILLQTTMKSPNLDKPEPKGFSDSIAKRIRKSKILKIDTYNILSLVNSV